MRYAEKQEVPSCPLVHGGGNSFLVYTVENGSRALWTRAFVNEVLGIHSFLVYAVKPGEPPPFSDARGTFSVSRTLPTSRESASVPPSLEAPQLDIHAGLVYAVKGRPLYVHVKGLAIVLLK